MLKWLNRGFLVILLLLFLIAAINLLLGWLSLKRTVSLQRLVPEEWRHIELFESNSPKDGNDMDRKRLGLTLDEYGAILSCYHFYQHDNRTTSRYVDVGLYRHSLRFVYEKTQPEKLESDSLSWSVPGIEVSRSAKLEWYGFNEYVYQIRVSVDYVLIAALTAIYPVVFFIRRYRRRRLNRQVLQPCGQCGYDLQGNESGTCPECGTATTRQIETEVAP